MLRKNVWKTCRSLPPWWKFAARSVLASVPLLFWAATVNAQVTSEPTKLEVRLGNHGKTFGMVARTETGTRFRLTYSPEGNSNSTVLALGDRAVEFGTRAGIWTSGTKTAAFHPVDKHDSVWEFDNLRVAQQLSVRTGSNHKRETCVAVFELKNLSDKPQEVGLRFLLDTFIGANDAPLISLPGSKKMVSNGFKLDKEEMPDFLAAHQFANFDKPGLTAYLTLKLKDKAIETPGTVLVTRLPRKAEAWDVPLEFDLRSDSVVVLYWPKRSLPPHATRMIGFAYGLDVIHLDAAKELHSK